MPVDACLVILLLLCDNIAPIFSVGVMVFVNNLLNKNAFLVKEHVGLFKAANNFDIYDPENGELILQCREPNLGWFTKLLRFTDYKRMTPFDIQIKTPDGKRIVRVQRGISLLLSNVEVRDEDNQLIALFKQNLFSIGGKFDIFDAKNNLICQLQGKWTGWDFHFIHNGRNLAHVSKQWMGMGKELFTSADNYMLSIEPNVEQDDKIRLVILAAVMCIDMVLKE